jgi:NTP pyrophosphatase (non-canonical NTP hydrolase)
MEIKEFQKEVLKVFNEMGELPNRKKHSKQSAVIHLLEEVGELAGQVTNEYHRPEKYNKENLGEELADIMMFIVLLADLYNIDLSVEMKKSIEKVENKIQKLKGGNEI